MCLSYIFNFTGTKCLPDHSKLPSTQFIWIGKHTHTIARVFRWKTGQIITIWFFFIHFLFFPSLTHPRFQFLLFTLGMRTSYFIFKKVINTQFFHPSSSNFISSDKLTSRETVLITFSKFVELIIVFSISYRSCQVGGEE